MTGKRFLGASVLIYLGALSSFFGSEAAVELPTIHVEDKAVATWRYAQTPEFQILSECDDDVTRKIAERFHRLHQLFGLILPDDLQRHSSVAPTLLIFDEDLLIENAKDEADVRRAATYEDADKLGSGNPGYGKSDFLRNTSVYDDQRSSILISVPRHNAISEKPSPLDGFQWSTVQNTGFDTKWTNLTPAYVSYIVAGNQPPLPLWFSTGFLSLYSSLTFGPDEVSLGPIEWVSQKETDRLKNSNAMTTGLIPLARFFTESQSATLNETQWLSESELIIRWALDKGYKKGLWEFVGRSRSEPVTEALFEHCFGMDYFAAETKLHTYLRFATESHAILVAPSIERLKHYVIRPASRSEIARVRGGFELIESTSVHLSHPDVSQECLESARLALVHAYDAGDRTPEIVADLGICNLGMGKNAEARSFLEAATSADVVMPRAYFELAQLRFAEASKTGEGLNPTQIEAILGLLRKADRQDPRLPEAFELATTVWSQAKSEPTEGDLAALEAGARTFPGKYDLILSTAQALYTHGFVARAQSLAETGMKEAPYEELRESFKDLLANPPKRS